MGKKEYGNYLTFAEQWLKEIQIKFVLEKSWQDSLLPFAITSQRKYLKTDDNSDRVPESSSKKARKPHCLIQ